MMIKTDLSLYTWDIAHRSSRPMWALAQPQTKRNYIDLN